MWWGLGGLYAVIWLVLMIWLGLRTLGNGHLWLFIFGIFLPIFWLFGAFMRPAAATS